MWDVPPFQTTEPVRMMQLPCPAPAIRRLAALACLLPGLCFAQSSASPNPPADVGAVVTTSSGLVFKLMKAGKGPSPAATDTVTVHYRGTLADGKDKGKEFDSSYSRGSPAEFPLNRVIKCWTEGVQMLKVGGSARLTCPPAIAYGERGAGGVIPPNATLTFDVELLGINGK